LEDGSKMTDEDHILAIYAKLSQERKDLSDAGIILKIEEDYKYKEDYIRGVIEKHKKSS
jgi:hypothetical protein